MTRMYCIMSKEALDLMGGNRGKLSAMAGHAFLHAFWDAQQKDPERAEGYRNSGSAFKIVLVTETTQEALDIMAEHMQYGTTVVKDAARTVFKEPTITCVGIGPLTTDECSDSMRALKPLL